MPERILTTVDENGRSRLGSREEIVEDNTIPIASVWNLWRVAPGQVLPGPDTPPAPLPNLGVTEPGEIQVFKFTFPGHTDSTTGGDVIEFTDERPGFHFTDSIDIQTLLEGELVLRLDDEDVVMRAGDTLVLRGHSHAWSNQSAEKATLLVTIVGATRAHE